MLQALNLPKVANLNPRSIYNKVDEFCTYVEEEHIDLVFMSESHERWYPTKKGENQTLNELIKLDNHIVVSNPSQRKGKGGRPALIVNNNKFHVKNLTQTDIEIPWGVEMVWAVLTPLNVTSDSNIQKIVVGSLYCKPNSRKKTILLDHIAEVYQQMNKKFSKGLHWILAGDFNDLKEQKVLDISPNLKQVVTKPTRMNPPAILDKIITTLHTFYQMPIIQPPLDNDPDKTGSPSDHKIVVMEPISTINNKPARTTKTITYRPITEAGIEKMETWFKGQTCGNRDQNKNVHEEAHELMNTLRVKTDECFPLKTRKITSDNQPFYTEKLSILKRRKQREYNKHRKSTKWINLNIKYNDLLDDTKKMYFKKEISKLRKSNPRKWFFHLKRLTSYDQVKNQEINLDIFDHMTKEEQAEKLADEFSSVRQEFDLIKKEDIQIPSFNLCDIPEISVTTVEKHLKTIKTNKSTTKDDIPPSVLKLFACHLSKPLSNLINKCIREGAWPDEFKVEIVTPVPKVYPPLNFEDLRSISGLLTFNKIAEKCLSELMIKDMKEKLDPCQFANQKGIGAQHYLIQMLNRIHIALDGSSKGEAKAVLATLVDWKQAFPRQCHKLGVEAFISNGVRPSLIPLLINYFQNRKLCVKWKGIFSKMRNLNGGGPQGATFGILEYLAQSNDNADNIEEQDRFKFVDDLTFLEILNLLSIEISSYDFQQHVASDIPTHNGYIETEKIKSQSQLSVINNWTKKKKMVLNKKKTKNMIFNFTKNHKFTIRMVEDNVNIKVVNETKLLGTYITSDLKWDRNTSYLVKKAWKRMQLLHKVSSFTNQTRDLKAIYITFVRPVLEQSSTVWHSSITQENSTDLERIQKSAVKLIMGKNYKSYNDSLTYLGLQTLKNRRDKLCLNFALKAAKHEKMKNMFPLRIEKRHNKRRKTEKYLVQRARNKRLKNTSIIYMQSMLNKHYQQKQIKRTHQERA